jgi:hypothetical protein
MNRGKDPDMHTIPVSPAARGARPGLRWLAAGEDGVAVLLLTVVLSMVALSIATATFMQSRTHRFELMRQRAEIYARYCSEYAVARYGVPSFMQNPELADGGTEENNWIEPRTVQDIMGNAFQVADNALTFRFAYDSLKMDKVYDVASSKPYYFVSAQGVVSWRDGNGRVHESRHRSAVGLTFSDFSRFMYFSNGEIGPENNQVTFGANENWYGRIHINGQANISQFGQPIFHGFFTQTEETVNNLSPGEYENVFQGGWTIPFPVIQWPPQNAIDQIKEQRLADHTYDDFIDVDVGGNVERHPLTTFLRFRDRRYWVAQYWGDTLANGVDTIYVPINGQNWISKNLPTAQGHEMIYVKGVCRLEGIVRGKLTVLASDSMFIMDNVITYDTQLSQCGDNVRFGVAPVGSPNRIGLACEKDIIIAATLPNGFSNGANNGSTCGVVYNPATGSNIGNVCDQGRKDVIITAALFAIGCSYEAEFWHTSAYGANLQAQLNNVAEGCDPPTNGDVRIWTPNVPPQPNWPANYHYFPCAGAAQFDDRRGTIWLCGSIVQTHRGFVIRNPGAQAPWGQAWIGYGSKVYRYDDNFLSGGPPVWFRVTYADGSQDVATEMVVPDYDRWRKSRRDFLND